MDIELTTLQRTYALEIEVFFFLKGDCLNFILKRTKPCNPFIYYTLTEVNLIYITNKTDDF